MDRYSLCMDIAIVWLVWDGETCSNIARSLLWVIASGVQQRDSLTCTEKSAYWVMPSAVRSVPYSEVRDISFTGKRQKQYHAAAAPPVMKQHLQAHLLHLSAAPKQTQLIH